MTLTHNIINPVITIILLKHRVYVIRINTRKKRYTIKIKLNKISWIETDKKRLENCNIIIEQLNSWIYNNPWVVNSPLKNYHVNIKDNETSKVIKTQETDSCSN